MIFKISEHEIDSAGNEGYVLLNEIDLVDESAALSYVVQLQANDPTNCVYCAELTTELGTKVIKSS